MRQFKTLALRSSATLALLGALSFTAQAQVVITDDTSEQVRTSTAGDDGAPADVTIGDDTSSPVVTIDAARSGVVLDSDNALILNGTVQADDIDGVTGVELQGGADRSYTQTGTIALVEDFTPPTDTDDDAFADGGFATGEGRTGILISGASAFQGNIELTSTSSIDIEGNDSFGINLAGTPLMTEGLTGNLLTSGQITVTGDRSTGINLAAVDPGEFIVTGDVINEGNIIVRGTDSQAIAVSGAIDGAFVSSGILSASGFRFDNIPRPGFAGNIDGLSGREDFTEEDLRQSGSVVSVSADVTGGILFAQEFSESVDPATGEVATDDDGNPILFLSAQSTISQQGSAPAILVSGDGTQITIGQVAQITDPTAEDFDADLLYGFVNQGSVATNGLFDDFDATAISFSDVTIEGGGVSNSGSLSSATFRAPNPTDLAEGGQGVARVIVFGDQAIADAINNSGAIVASVSEAIDEVFFDRTNIIEPRSLLAVAIDVGEGASLPEIVNSGVISSVLLGREGSAIAIRDASGTVSRVNNTGFITTSATTSDTLNLEETDFNLVAIDLSTNTNDIEINQSQNPDSTINPLINGDILLGSGDDSLIASAGTIMGDVDFGGGADTLALSGGSFFEGTLRNSDSLAISVTEGATLSLASTEDIQVSEALVDSTSIYRPVINGETGDSSVLVSAGNITFEDGATINPVLESIVGTETFEFEIASAGNLTIGDLASLGAGDNPFLFNTSLSLAENDPNTLIITLNLRDASASVADGGLGLDAVQAAAFGSVVNGEFQEGAVLQALNASQELGNAFANITTFEEFNAAYNQILPEFSGAAKQFVLANVDGAVGAVGSQLDTARRSPDKPGGAWLEEFFYFADRERAGLSEQYRGEGFGFAGGLDTSWGPFHAVGVTASFASTEIEDVVGVDDPLDVRTYQLGTYAGFEKNGFSFDIYGGGGISEFEQSRFVSFGGFDGNAQGDWEGIHANGSIRAGYDLPISDKYWARPSVSVDYLYLNEYGRTETGTEGVRLRVNGRNSETAAATAMLNFGANFQGKRTWIRPSLRVGYRNEFISDRVETSFSFQGLTNDDGDLFDSELATLRAFAFPDEGLLLGFTVAAGSEYSSIGFDFDSDIRDGFIRHTGRIVIRLLF